jgi:hypothetical protein
VSNNLLFQNNATSTLAGAISDVATAANLAVGTGSRFPNPTGSQYFVMTFTDAATGLLNEIVHVTARTGDVITIVRAQEGTTALNWQAGDLADSLITAGQLGAMVQTSDLQETAGAYVTDSGSANSIVATLSPAPASYADLVGSPIRVRAAATSTGAAVVVNLNSLGSKPVVNQDGSGLAAGQLTAGGIVTITYDGLNFQLGSPLASATPTGTDRSTKIATTQFLDNAFAAMQSLGANGYQKLPGGLILQWGLVSVVGTGGTTWNFPTPFTTACYGVLAMCNTGSGVAGPTSVLAASSLTLTSALVDFHDDTDVFVVFAVALGK